MALRVPEVVTDREAVTEGDSDTVPVLDKVMDRVSVGVGGGVIVALNVVDSDGVGPDSVILGVAENVPPVTDRDTETLTVSLTETLVEALVLTEMDLELVILSVVDSDSESDCEGV